MDKKELLVQSTDEVVSQLVETNDADEIKRLTQLFNVNQMKKDAIRTLKLNDMLDKLDDQVLKRIETHPDQFSNADLLNYLNTIQQNINKSAQNISSLNQTPLIQLNQQNNIMVSNEFNRESREKIISAVKQLLEFSNNDENGDGDVVYYDNEEVE